MIEPSGQMQHWLRVVEGVQTDAAGGVVRRRSPLDLWRLSGVKQVSASWFEFTMEVDTDNLRAGRLEALGRRVMVIRANASRMPALRNEAGYERARENFLAMAMFFLTTAAVETAPDAEVEELPAYVWPTWIRKEVSS